MVSLANTGASTQTMATQNVNDVMSVVDHRQRFVVAQVARRCSKALQKVRDVTQHDTLPLPN
jgi:hypothetical protein